MAYFCQKGPTGELLKCPYDKNHLVSKYKMFYHVKKCRERWTLETMKKGERVNVFVCQHNSEHRLPSPELKWHEAQCPDRKKVRSYQVNGAQALKDAGQWPEWMMEVPTFKPDAKELREVWKPDKLGVIVGSDNFGEPVRMDEILDPNLKHQRVAEARGRALAEELMREEELEKERKMLESMTPEDRQEYEEWNKVDETREAFDFMKIASNPKPEWRRYPINLTKQQRKAYEKQVAKMYTPVPY